MSDLYIALSRGTKPKDKRLYEIVEKLRSNKSKSIIVCDSNDTNTQLIVNNINSLLKSYDNTISFKRAFFS